MRLFLDLGSLWVASWLGPDSRLTKIRKTYAVPMLLKIAIFYNFLWTNNHHSDCRLQVFRSFFVFVCTCLSSALRESRLYANEMENEGPEYIVYMRHPCYEITSYLSRLASSFCRAPMYDRVQAFWSLTRQDSNRICATVLSAYARSRSRATSWNHERCGAIVSFAMS